jgi:diguanylate cyclase (GGDEF)-like protein/PAS domain S-box-containing protein
MSRPTIICIDDEPLILHSLREQLTRCLNDEFAVELAEGGAEAIALLEELMRAEVDIPLVICDQIMPDISGDYVLAEIHDRHPKALKILLTGMASMDSVIHAINHANLYRYISKPWSETDLNLTVREAIRSYFQEKRLLKKNRILQEVNQRLQQEIAERKRTERSLHISETRLEHILNSLEDVIWSASPDTLTLQYLNPVAERIYGRPVEELLNLPDFWLEVVYEGDRPILEEKQRQLQETHSSRSEYRIVRPDGELRWLSDRAHMICDAQGSAIRVDGIIHDITDRKQGELQLMHLALHDSLTGLPNRKFFLEQVERLLNTSETGNSVQFAVLFIDLDRFKVINDSLGHVVGDHLLVAIAKRLKHCVRSEDLVSRLGGDEFTVLLNPIQDIQEAIEIADRILTQLSIPFDIQGHQFGMSASIGIIEGGQGYTHSTDLLRDADTAMYHAKTQGKACYSVFHQSMHDQTLNLWHLESDLQKALHRCQLFLHYQPIVSLSTGQISGFEALLRWNHPQRGLVPPDEFIPIAEESGLILVIGEWVLREACQQIQHWKTQFPQHSALTISINLSNKQLKDIRFVDIIDQVLRETGLEGKFLTLELTESMLIDDLDSIIKTLTQLRERGIHLSIDDFGKGYSSLSYLHKLPIDSLKIDRLFTNQIGVNPESCNVVRGLSFLARSLGLTAVIEGIETANQLLHLENLDCAAGQGYYFSPPLGCQEIEKLLSELSWQCP